jgi:Fe-S-cluster containining protein
MLPKTSPPRYIHSPTDREGEYRVQSIRTFPLINLETPSKPVEEYVCDQCGACCKGHLIVCAESLDVLREPRLIQVDPYWQGKSVGQVVDAIEHEMKVVMLACSSPCSFLGGDNRCTIYPTRPNDCVAMQAGDEQCQMARDAEGLPPLLPLHIDCRPDGMT